MTNGRRLVGNSAWNTASFLAALLLNVLLLPFVVSNLGLAAFGVAGLAIACIAPALIFSNTLTLMTTRELASRLTREERSEARRFFSAALFLAATAGMAIAATLFVAGPLIGRKVFNLDHEHAADLQTAVAFGAAGWAFQCLNGGFLALFMARQDYRRLAWISISGSVSAAALILCVVPLWPHASGYMACLAGGFAVSFGVAVAISLRSLRPWVAQPEAQVVQLKRLVELGGWQAAAQGSGLATSHVDRYLLGMFLPPQFVGIYLVAQRLEEAVYIGVIKIGEVLFPYFSSRQGESLDRTSDLLFRSSWIVSLLAISALGAIIPVSGALLNTWMGTEVTAQGETVLVTLAVAGMLACTSNAHGYYLMASGRTRAVALIAFCSALFAVPTSILFISSIGWLAVGWSACVAALIKLALTVAMVRQRFATSDVWPRILHFILVPVGVGMGIALALRAVVGEVAPTHIDGWGQVVLVYCLVAGLIALGIVATAMFGRYGSICRRDLGIVAASVRAIV